MAEKKLTPLQEAFILHFRECRNGAEALRRAGSESKNPNVDASKMLALPSVQEAIKKLDSELADKLGLKAEDIIRGFQTIAQFDPMKVIKLDSKTKSWIYRDDIPPEYLVAANFTIYPEYQTKEDKRLGITRARFSISSGDRKGAWEVLAKIRGLLGDQLETDNAADKVRDEALAALDQEELNQRASHKPTGKQARHLKQKAGKS